MVYGSICKLLNYFCVAHGIDKKKIQKLYLELQTETSLVNFTDTGPLQLETDADTIMVGLTINNSLTVGEAGKESLTDYSLLGACLLPLLGDEQQHSYLSLSLSLPDVSELCMSRILDMKILLMFKTDEK